MRTIRDAEAEENTKQPGLEFRGKQQFRNGVVISESFAHPDLDWEDDELDLRVDDPDEYWRRS